MPDTWRIDGTSEGVVVHGERVGTATLQQQEAFGVVLAIEQIERCVVVAFQLAQTLNQRGPGRCGYDLAKELLCRCDA